MLDLHFHPFPVIRTPRLLLRKITREDAFRLFALRNDIHAMQYIGKKRAEAIEEIYTLMERMEEGERLHNSIAWGISLHEDPTLIGTIGYHKIEKENDRAEIGYMLDPAYWSKGMMSESISEILLYGWEKMRLHTVEARVDPGNIASIQLLQKKGFQQEGYFKENFFFDGKFLDTAVYSLRCP